MARLTGRTFVYAMVIGAACTAQPCVGGFVFSFSDPSGLSAEAEFTLLNATTLQIRLRNTSTGVPVGFSNSDQILTGLSWDFGAPGINPGDITITGGSAVIGPSSASVNFSTGAYGAGTDIGGEWGFGNSGISGLLANAISGNQSGMTAFGGANLDGPAVLDGPQGGLISSAFSLDLGGLGAIENEIVATLTLSGAITEAQLFNDLSANGIIIEFGSDAAFIPAPGALALLGLAALGRRRRRNA
jgi:hypothetical protein